MDQIAMDKDTLIAQQSLEIASLKERISLYEECCKKIHLECVAIGAPLNDNKLGYSREQLGPFNRINLLATAQ